jgi:hypothetical protein
MVTAAGISVVAAVVGWVNVKKSRMESNVTAGRGGISRSPAYECRSGRGSTT